MSKNEFEDAARSGNVSPSRRTNSHSVSKEELHRVIARQRELLEKPDLRLDPPWVNNPYHQDREELRKVSRARTRITTRLDKARQKFENDFDLSS